MAQKSPRCVNLGDCHQGNTYVMPNGERVWLDWPLVSKGRPWRDLTYMTMGALTIEERRSSERGLLAHYLSAPTTTGPGGLPTLTHIFNHIPHRINHCTQPGNTKKT